MFVLAALSQIFTEQKASFCKASCVSLHVMVPYYCGVTAFFAFVYSKYQVSLAKLLSYAIFLKSC